MQDVDYGAALKSVADAGMAGTQTGMPVAMDAGGAVGGYPTVDYSQMAEDWADPTIMSAPAVPTDPTGGMIDVDALAGMLDVGPTSVAQVSPSIAGMATVDFDPYGGIGTGGGMVDPTWGGQPGHMTSDAGAGMLAMGLPGLGLTAMGAGKAAVPVSKAIEDLSRRAFLSKSAKAAAAAVLSGLGLGKLAKVVTTGWKAPVPVVRSKNLGDSIEFIFEDGTKQIVKKGKRDMKSLAPLTAATELVDMGVTIDKDDIAEMVSQVDTFKDIPAAPAGPSAADIERDKQAAIDARKAEDARQAAINAQMAQEAAARQQQQEAARQAQIAVDNAAALAQQEKDIVRQANRIFGSRAWDEGNLDPAQQAIMSHYQDLMATGIFDGGGQGGRNGDRASVGIDAGGKYSGGGPF
jgi:hypothetical protein